VSASRRRPLISGNWKMNLTHRDAVAVVQKLAVGLGRPELRAIDVSIHPPFTALRSVQTLLDADEIPISLGAQNVFWEERGAYTGEVSPLMLAKLTVSYVIVGHSERRHYFGETDDVVNKKVMAVLKSGMTPILCVGETLEERAAGVSESTVLGQLERGLAGLGPEPVAGLVLAYEPVWAIGTGLTASPEDCQAMCHAVRGAVASNFGTGAGAGVRIQYGGSVQASNIAALMAQDDVDGALVGGASLNPDEFVQIVELAHLKRPGSRQQR
jgi:triosephosphate isomerase (TIM)